MGRSLLVSEREYLTPGCQPDCDYDDGELLERNVGERPHSILQGEFSGYFRDLRKQRRLVRAFAEQRVRIAARKYLWVIETEALRADVYTASVIYEAKDGMLHTEDPLIEVPLAELFQALDD